MDSSVRIEKSNPSSFLDDFKKCIADYDVSRDEPAGLTEKIDNTLSLSRNNQAEPDAQAVDKAYNDRVEGQIFNLSVKSERKVNLVVEHNTSNNNQDERRGDGPNEKECLDVPVEDRNGIGNLEGNQSSSTSVDGVENLSGVTRYNIITGSIMQYQQKPCPVKKDLVRRYTNEESEADFSNDLPVPVPDQSGSTAKDYACKVCLKGFDSRSSLRKHICRLAPDGDEDGKENMEEAMDMTLTGERSMEEESMLEESLSAEGSVIGDSVESNPVNHGEIDLSIATKLQPMPVERMYPTQDDIKMLTEEATELKNQQGQLFMCPICSMTFTQASVLTRHYRSHSNERPHECKDCHKAFRRKCHLKRHWQRIHSGEKPFKCGICGKAFSDRDHQRQHETIHGPETYPCLKCRSVFPTDGYLAAHVAQHPDCKAAFAQNAENQAKRIRGPKGKSVPGSYRCGLCGDFFKKLRQIQTHQRVRHHDAFEKKYKCNICQKGFDLISDLTHHRNGHVLRGSKYDTDKDSKPSVSQSVKKMVRPEGELGSENKAELMEMLQQLEKRIQQQERKVQQMEHRQEHIGDEFMESPHEIDFPEDELGHRLRYMFEHKGDFLGGSEDSSQDMINTTKKQAFTSLENGALDFSVPKKIKLEKPSPENMPFFPPPPLPTNSQHFDGSSPMELQSKAVLDLMFRNRHKCKECGLSFLLYSEFRDHRKRHERARAAFGIEGNDVPKQSLDSSSPHMICGNPDGDRNLCRDCCKDGTSGNHNAPVPHVHETSEASMKRAESNGDVSDMEPNLKTHTRSMSGIHKIRQLESPYVSVVKRQDCTRCTYLQEELQQEREDRMTLQDEVEGLRDVLLQFASFASKYPTLDNQLLALLQKNHSKLNRGRQPSTEEREVPNGTEESVS